MRPARLLALIAIPLLLGLAISLAVISGATEPVDRFTALLFKEGLFAVDNPRWREGLRDFTALGSFAVLGFALLGACAFLAASGRWKLSSLLLVSVLCATATSMGVKHILGRARPNLDMPVVTTFSSSFPSGHAFLSTVFFLSIGALLARSARSGPEKRVILFLSFFLAIAIGASRVVLGVHWLTDVVAGWLFGVAWAATTFLLALRLVPSIPDRRTAP